MLRGDLWTVKDDVLSFFYRAVSVNLTKSREKLGTVTTSCSRKKKIIYSLKECMLISTYAVLFMKKW